MKLSDIFEVRKSEVELNDEDLKDARHVSADELLLDLLEMILMEGASSKDEENEIKLVILGRKIMKQTSDILKMYPPDKEADATARAKTVESLEAAWEALKNVELE